jgi:FkbM family methyltransferase
MTEFLSDLLAFFTRTLAFIPGMYVITKPLHRFFTAYFTKHPEKAWRTIRMNGYKMKLNVSYRMAALVYWRGAHEWAPIYLLKNTLKPGMNFYDVGANMGEFTLLAANAVGENGKVFSFEPMSEMFGLLQHNIALNNFQNRVGLFNIALSDKKGEADLFAATEVNEVGSHEDGLHTLYGTKERSVFLQKIQLEKLDELFTEKNLSKPDVLKVDVEGAELFVLKGAEAILKKYQPKIILEFNSETSEAAGYTQQDLLSFLKPLGYQFYEIGNRGKLSLLNETNLPALTNLFCVVN